MVLFNVVKVAFSRVLKQVVVAEDEADLEPLENFDGYVD